MTIKTSNENQRAFRDSEMDERVVWDDFQMADLSDDLEEYLVETYDSIVYVDEGDRPEDDETDAESEAEATSAPENEDESTVESRAAEAVGDLESEDGGGDDDTEASAEDVADTEAVDVEDETDE